MYDKVSIIIPTYNSLSTIKRCVNSCVYQSYKNLDIVVVDDGSTDGTSDFLIKEFAYERRIKIFKTENNGVSEARNFGIQKATGKFLVFLDSDDELCVDAISNLIKKSRNKDVVIGNYINVSNRGEHISDIKYQNFVDDYFDSKEYQYSCCYRLYSAKILEGVNFNKELSINEDFYFNFLVLLKKPSFAVVKNPVSKIYFSEGSASREHVFNEKYKDIIKVADYKCSLINSKYTSYKSYVPKIIFNASLDYISVCITKKKSLMGNFERKCIRNVRKFKHVFKKTNYIFRNVLFYSIKYHFVWLFSLLYKIRRGLTK